MTSYIQRSRALPYIDRKLALFLAVLVVYALCQFSYQIDDSTNSRSSPETKYISAKKPLRYSSSSSPEDFELAKKESFGFFTDVPEHEWIVRRRITAEIVDHLDPNNVTPSSDDDGWEKYFAWYYENYEPNFSCSFERRVGGNGNGDGPKWVCDPHRITRIAEERIKSSKIKTESTPACVIYSIGSNGDFQFELGMQEIIGEGLCEIHIFDMGDYGKDMPKELKNAHYHRWGITAQDDSLSTQSNETSKEGEEFYGLKDTLKMLGHDKLESIDIFKIDCENCEWTSFPSWLDPDLPRLSQILVEVHKPPRSISTVFFDTLQANGYVRFHKEVNCKHYTGGAAEFSFLKVSTDFFPPEKLKLPLLKSVDEKELKKIVPDPPVQVAQTTEVEEKTEEETETE